MRNIVQLALMCSGEKGFVSSIDRARQDSTLITTESGRKFATSASDWKFWHDSVASELQSLHDSGHALVIISNQGGIAKGWVAGAVVLWCFTSG